VLPVVPVRTKHVADHVEAAGEDAVQWLGEAAEPLRERVGESFLSTRELDDLLRPLTKPR
jgi:hypothetical protein